MTDQIYIPSRSARLAAFILSEAGVSGIHSRADVNRIAREQVNRSNVLQKATSRMVDEHIRAGRSYREAWAIIEKTLEWKEFTNHKRLYSPDTDLLHRLIDQFEQGEEHERTTATIAA